MSETFWWPKSLDTLRAEVNEEGIELFAEDNSPAGEWLDFWNQTKERHAIFQEKMISSLLGQCEHSLNNLNETDDSN